jgi:hypothetical protein
MSSTVATALLAVELAEGGRAFGPYVSVVLSEAERDGDAIDATFDSIQPPDTPSDELRRQLDALLSPATSLLTELRIAARRGDIPALASLAPSLRAVGRQLDAFVSDQAASST